eukprot:UN23464
MINKKGFFGLLPKYFRSQARFDLYKADSIKEIFIEEKRQGRNIKTYGLTIKVEDETNPIITTDKLLYAFYSNEDATKYKFRLSNCIHKIKEDLEDKCTLHVESSYWEEFWIFIAIIAFFYISIFQKRVEKLTLFQTSSSFQIERKNIINTYHILSWVYGGP